MTAKITGAVLDKVTGLPLAGIEVATFLVIRKFVDWWDGEFARMSFYGTDYQVLVNSGWNENYFRTPPISAAVSDPNWRNFYPPTHSIVIEVWATKADYLAKKPPIVSKDLKGTDGLWVVNDRLMFGAFYRYPGYAILTSDPEPV